MLLWDADSQNQNRSPFLPPTQVKERPCKNGVRDRLRGSERSLQHPAPGGPGVPTGRSSTDTSPFPAITDSVSPRAPRAAGLTLGAGTEDLRGPDTDQAPLDTVTDPHTRDRTKNGSSLRFASGLVPFFFFYFATQLARTPTPAPPRAAPTCSL